MELPSSADSRKERSYQTAAKGQVVKEATTKKGSNRTEKGKGLLEEEPILVASNYDTMKNIRPINVNVTKRSNQSSSKAPQQSAPRDT